MPLFIIRQHYHHPEAVEQFHAEHVAWIERHAMAGTFLLAGPTESAGGSIILASAESHEQVARLTQEDAFLTNGVVASTEIIEFRPRRGSLRKSPANPLYIKPDE